MKNNQLSKKDLESMKPDDNVTIMLKTARGQAMEIGKGTVKDVLSNVEDWEEDGTWLKGRLTHIDCYYAVRIESLDSTMTDDDAW